MGNPALFSHEQSGPYEQLARVWVQDGGNKLPVHLGLLTGDPYNSTSHSMTVRDAEVFHQKLGRAIEVAKEAGL